MLNQFIDDEFSKLLRACIQSLSLAETVKLWKSNEMNLAQFGMLTTLQRYAIVPCSCTGFENNTGILDTETKNHIYSDPNKNKMKYSDGHKVDCPPEILAILSIDNSCLIRKHVAGHVNTPAHILESLSRDTDVEVRMEVARNPNTPSAVLEMLSADNDEGVQLYVSRNASTPLTVIQGYLAVDDGLHVAANNATPWSVLKELVGSDSEKVLLSVAENINCRPDISLEILRKLSGSKHLWIVRDVSRSIKCDLHILNELRNNSDVIVKRNILLNPNCTSAIFQSLLEENFDDKEIKGDHHTLQQIANNSHCSDFYTIKIFKELKSGTINFSESQKTRPRVLELLANNSELSYTHPSIAKNPRTPLTVLERWVDEDYEKYFASIAINPNITENIVSRLEQSKDVNVQINLLTNPKCSLDSFSRASKSNNRKLRVAVALSPHCPENIRYEALNAGSFANIIKKNYFPGSLLEKLAMSEVEDVSVSAKENSNHPKWRTTIRENYMENPWFKEMLERASESVQHAVLDGNISFFEGKDSNKTVLSKSRVGVILALASSNEIKLDNLNKMSKSNDALIRMAVARNPRTPLRTLTEMTEDKEKLVSTQAKSTLKMVR